MANSIAKLAILLTTDATGMRKGFAQGISDTQHFVNDVRSKLSAISLAGLAGGAGFLGWGVKLAAEAETASVAFRVMLGDADKAKKLLSEIKTFALESPLKQSDLRDGAQTLLQFGVAGENIMPVMRMLGDVSLGQAERFRLLSLAFGQMSAAGRLTGQDLLQMINSGFNPLDEIAKKTGESLAQVKDRMSEGGVSAQEVVQAFQSATAAGGRFHGMMDAMTETMAGKFSKLTEQTQLLAMGIAQRLVPSLNTLMQIGTSVIDWLGKVDRSTVVWVGSIAAAIAITPRIVSAVRAIVGAFRAMATAQSIQQALAGPAGWATLATGLGIAAAAAITINTAFDRANESLAKHSVEAKKAADAAKGLNVGLFAGAAPNNSAAEEAAKAAKKHLDDLRQKGEQLTDSLRTPFEKIRDDLAEAFSLFHAGVISAETYARAQAKAREDLQAQAESADQIRNRLQTSSTPALQYGSQAALASIDAIRRSSSVDREVDRQLIAQAKETNEKLRRIEVAIKGKETVNVKEITL